MSSIVIYGIQRTGTNYIEYLVRNNINCTYLTYPQPPYNAYMFFNGKTISRKHCVPNINYGDYHIIILKKLKNWIPSILKYINTPDVKPFIDINQYTLTRLYVIYDLSNQHYIDFYTKYPDRVVIVYHEDLLNNEKEFINYVCDKFSLPKKSATNNVHKTNKIMDKSGGLGIINDTYKGIPDNPEIDLSNINQKYVGILEDISWKKN